MKNIITDSLDSILLKYSLAAGAVLLGTKEVDAQVHITTVNTVVDFAHPTYNIDFNGDHITDVQINYTSEPGAAFMVSGSAFRAIQPIPIFNYIKALSKSTSIGSSNADMKSGVIYNILTYAGASRGYWKGVTDKYMGVRFKISGQIHYGWVKMSFKGISIDTIKSFAYEETPNKAISPSVLPVELTSFMARTVGSTVELIWKTATEVNNYGFEVERSNTPLQFPSREGKEQSDRGVWEKVGFVKGSGTSNSPKTYSFVDDNPLKGKAEYRLKQENNDGTFKYSSIINVNSIPVKFELSQNYPNPFNPTTTIKYSLAKAEHVTLKVYDELGNEVKSLVNGTKEAGRYRVEFNGSGLASGIYYYRIQAGNFNQVKKLMLLK